MIMVSPLAGRRAAPTLPAMGAPSPLQSFADAHNALAMGPCTTCAVRPPTCQARAARPRRPWPRCAVWSPQSWKGVRHETQPRVEPCAAGRNA